jgi:hypothetical protein
VAPWGLNPEWHIVVKQGLWKLIMRVWIGFSWVRIGMSPGLL